MTAFAGLEAKVLPRSDRPFSRTSGRESTFAMSGVAERQAAGEAHPLRRDAANSELENLAINMAGALAPSHLL